MKGALDIRPIGGSFALEVRGLRLWERLDDEAVAEIGRAWATAGVLVFRRQALSEGELAAFSARFGELEAIVRDDWSSPGRPEVINISNLRDAAGRAIGGLGAGELGWHSDQSYMARPATGSVLYMVEMPPEGSATYWANLASAYAALPEALRTRSEDRRAVFDYARRQSGYDDEAPMSEALRARTPVVTHPLVNRHPVSGAGALYLDPTTTVGVEGLDPAEGAALLDELAAHATRPEFVYAHRWQIGDVVMWDNGFLLHRRDAFDPARSRLLKRTTLRLPPARHIVPEGAPLGEHVPR